MPAHAGWIGVKKMVEVMMTASNTAKLNVATVYTANGMQHLQIVFMMNITVDNILIMGMKSVKVIRNVLGMAMMENVYMIILAVVWVIVQSQKHMFKVKSTTQVMEINITLIVG